VSNSNPNPIVCLVGGSKADLIHTKTFAVEIRRNGDIRQTYDLTKEVTEALKIYDVDLSFGIQAR
jgi:hypothetical protein